MSDDPKDPRFRPYRGLAWAVYLTVAVGFSSLIIYSVFKSVLTMTPDAPTSVGSPLDEAQCLARAKTLFDELEVHRKSLADAPDTSRADQAFLDFRLDWLKRKRDTEARCGLDARPRAQKAFASLERVLDLYTTASVQFAGGVGPAIDEFKSVVDARP